MTEQSEASFRNRVTVRVDGLNVIEERERVRGPWVVRLEEDPQPKARRSGTGLGILGVAVVLSIAG